MKIGQRRGNAALSLFRERESAAQNPPVRLTLQPARFASLVPFLTQWRDALRTRSAMKSDRESVRVTQTHGHLGAPTDVRTPRRP